MSELKRAYDPDSFAISNVPSTLRGAWSQGLGPETSPANTITAWNINPVPRSFLFASRTQTITNASDFAYSPPVTSWPNNANLNYTYPLEYWASWINNATTPPTTIRLLAPVRNQLIFPVLPADPSNGPVSYARNGLKVSLMKQAIRLRLEMISANSSSWPDNLSNSARIVPLQPYNNENIDLYCNQAYVLRLEPTYGTNGQNGTQFMSACNALAQDDYFKENYRLGQLSDRYLCDLYNLKVTKQKICNFEQVRSVPIQGESITGVLNPAAEGEQYQEISTGGVITNGTYTGPGNYNVPPKFKIVTDHKGKRVYKCDMGKRYYKGKNIHWEDNQAATVPEDGPGFIILVLWYGVSCLNVAYNRITTFRDI